MTIAVFTRCLNSGGTERVIARLSLLWHDLGYDIVFFTQKPESNDDFPHGSRMRMVAPSSGWSGKDIQQALTKFKFDWVVINGGWNESWIEDVVATFKEKSTAKVLSILHHSFDNWLFSLANAGDFAKKTLLGKLDLIVCVDPIQAFWWSRRHSRVVYVPNPVAFQVMDRSATENEANAHTMVWVGRPNDIGKRVELAVKIYDLVREKVPDARLTIVGSISDALRNKLIESVRDPRGLVYTGYVDDVRELVAKSRIHLVTTLWEVTVPQVVLEAHALGIPTVAMDIPILKSAKGCVLSESVESLADKIVELMLDSGKWMLLSMVARTWAREVTDVSILKEKWQSVLAVQDLAGMDKLVRENVASYATVEVAERLIDEVQRAEGYFVSHHLPFLNRMLFWRSRFFRLSRLIGLKRKLK